MFAHMPYLNTKRRRQDLHFQTLPAVASKPAGQTSSCHPIQSALSAKRTVSPWVFCSTGSRRLQGKTGTLAHAPPGSVYNC